MRTLIFLSFFIICSFSVAQDSITVEAIEKQLAFLASDELAGRGTGTEGIEKAAKFIETDFLLKGIKPFYTTYRDSFMVNKKHAYNIIGLVEGTDKKLKNEFIIVGAHYDHIGVVKRKVEGDSIANGANDNASGSVGVMQLANHFVKNPTKRSFLFVLFSAEEVGLRGSRHLASRMKNENTTIHSVFNIEMIGVPLGDAHAYAAYFTGFEKSNFEEIFNQDETFPILGSYEEAEKMQLFKRSDNWPFYQELNIPAHTVCTFDFTNYDYYHHPKDEVNFMNIAHMQQLIKAFAKGLERVANTDAEIKLK